MLGHSGEVFAVRFDPSAQHIASGSMDRSIRMSLHDTFHKRLGANWDRLQYFGIHTDSVKTLAFYRAIAARSLIYNGREIRSRYSPHPPT